VTSSNTAFTYGNQLVETKRIGRDLSVRYALEGSVQRSGNRVRVDTQLIDTENDTQLWTERFDRDAGDPFALQSEITSRIRNALTVELIAAEAARPTEHPDAFDYILRGRAVSLKPNSREVYAETISWYERALALDPQSVKAMSLLANAFASRVTDGMTDTYAADITRSEALVDQALAKEPRSGYAHFVKGKVLLAQNQPEEAILEFETSLNFDRNSVWALHNLAICKLRIGAIEEVIPLEDQAIRLSPQEPHIGWWYRVIGIVYLLQSRTDEAIVLLEKSRSSIPAASVIRANLAGAYGIKGDTGRAAAELGEARRLADDGRFSTMAQLSRRYWGVPRIRALAEATLFAGLRKAGVPEE
jgi:tetratricopeptide (TPR) repeat protein